MANSLPTGMLAYHIPMQPNPTQPTQEPEHPILETVLELLVAQPCGKRWVSTWQLIRGVDRR